MAFNPPAFALNYPPSVTVTVTMTAAPGCTAANPSYNVAVTATGPRTVLAQVYRSNAVGNPWLVRWAQFQ
jgi:hypothetical protein